jgi:hypothetical protein
MTAKRHPDLNVGQPPALLISRTRMGHAALFKLIGTKSNKAPSAPRDREIR